MLRKGTKLYTKDGRVTGNGKIIFLFETYCTIKLDNNNILELEEQDVIKYFYLNKDESKSHFRFIEKDGKKYYIKHRINKENKTLNVK